MCTFSINFKSTLINTPRKVPRNSPYFTILNSLVFDNFILANELFEKALKTPETCLTVNNNLCEKLVLRLELAITFDERFKITSVLLFIPGFTLLSCQLHSFTFKLLY